MTWDKDALRGEVIRWERALRTAGVSRADSELMAGHAIQFVNWLPEAHGDEEPYQAPSPRQPAPRGGAPGASAIASGSGGETAALTALAEALKLGHRQAAIPWPRENWISAFPAHAAFLRSLPRVLDRDAVREVARDAYKSPLDATQAFLAVMAWGFGNVGYGPFRTGRMLDDTPGSSNALMYVARELQRGPLAAYASFARQNRLKWLGPAFGTKYLYFAQGPSMRPRALILDALVSEWLGRYGIDMPSLQWRREVYDQYLELMASWATKLGVEPDDVEYLIFQAMADERGGQWASEREVRATVPQASAVRPTILFVKLAPWVDDDDRDLPRSGYGFRPGMSARELVDSARAWWVLDPERAAAYEYLGAVADGHVVGFWRIRPGSWRWIDGLRLGKSPRRWACDVDEGTAAVANGFVGRPAPRRPDGRPLFGSGAVIAYWPT